MSTLSSDKPIIEALDYHGPLSLDEIGYAQDDAAARNRLRAYWAAQALKTYAELVGFDTLESTTGDLLADLRHLFQGAGEHLEPGNDPEDAFTDVQEQAFRRWCEETYDSE